MMSGEPQYTQIKRPVSRVAEKVLGWLNWIGLLFLTVITMFIALVSFSNNTSIQNLEQAINGNQFAQQVLTNNSLNTTQFVIWLQNGIWAVIVYLIVCLLISFLALISMNIRVLSGILFLIASIITLPLVLLLATIVIPVLFFIVAIMMFARKDKVETVPYYPGAYGGYDDYRGSDYDDRYYDRNQRHAPSYDEREEYEEDDVKRYEPKHKASKPAYELKKNDAYDENMNESHPYEEVGQNEQETPDFLSRQAKYKQKSADEVKEQQENDAYEREQARINAMDQEEEPEEIKYRDTEPKKGETAEEKEARKLEKKERKKRAKEARKNRPSAVNQRRMNFEERRSHLVGKSNEKVNTQTPEDKDNQEQQEDKE